MLKRHRLILLGLLSSFIAFGAEAEAGKEVSKPNIIFILADDMGIDSVSANNPDLPTHRTAKVRWPKLPKELGCLIHKIKFTEVQLEQAGPLCRMVSYKY